MTVIQKALATACPSLRDVARAAGVSYAAVRSWKLGTRVPTSTGRLPRVLRKQAGQLLALADQLEV